MRTGVSGTVAGAVGVLVMVLAAVPGLAGDFDGSKLLICAPVEALDCAPGVACEKSTPQEMGLPAFLRIDFAGKALVGPNRTTPIELMEKTDAQILLRGTELGYAWTVALDATTGQIATTLVNREEVFVLFGACTPL
jgi:hypothetical protein